MKRLCLFILLSSLPVLASAQLPDPVITSVSPTAGPSAGGNDVTITGSGFATNILCILPCPPLVLFGDIEVPAKDQNDSRLIVTAPAHASGTVDIKVHIADGREATAPAAYTFAASAEDNWEKALLPIFLDAPLAGSNGTRWETDFWLRNNGTVPVQLAPWPCETICPAVIPLISVVPGGQSRHGLPPYLPILDGNPSRVLFLSKAEAKNVSMQLRVADVSRGTLDAGTELPVVRDRELLTGDAQLLNVPYAPSRFRMMLRIYDLAYSQSRFRVTLYAQEEGAGSSALYSAELNAESFETDEFRSQAAYAQTNFDELELLDRNWPTAFRIEITPLTPGSRYYPLVSVTNNETQLVTLVTPQ
ncbi:MAG: hypothetical protein QOH21_1047 [Acidobacteriota bacterium]|jgi:hypothetical protein|nr:hypothetical protein [Acidobacteriota bacterium]